MRKRLTDIFVLICLFFYNTGKLYAVKDVVEGMEYEFRVAAINNSGAGEFSTPSEFVFARDPKSRWKWRNSSIQILCRDHSAVLSMICLLQSLQVKSSISKWQTPPTQPCPYRGPNLRTSRGWRMKPRGILLRSGLQKIQNGIAAIQMQLQWHPTQWKAWSLWPCTGSEPYLQMKEARGSHRSWTTISWLCLPQVRNGVIKGIPIFAIRPGNLKNQIHSWTAFSFLSSETKIHRCQNQEFHDCEGRKFCSIQH